MIPSPFMNGPQHMTPGDGQIMAPPFLNMGGGMMGMLGPMVLEPMLRQYLGPGFMPAQLLPNQNVYDLYRRRANFEAMQQASMQAAKADQTTYVNFLRGVANTSGVQWNDQREMAARQMAQDLARWTPTLAPMMGDTFDRMHGSRGSAVLFAQNMFQGGRYAMDPITGRPQLSADSVAQMTNRVYEMAYGPGASLAEMRGIGAGQLGRLYDEIQRRGLGAPAMTADQMRRGAARQMVSGGEAGSLADAMDQLNKMATPDLERRLREFEGGRVAERLKSLTGAVAAIKDVFGEMGQPDAPMAQLIEGLQVLTQSGLASMTPERVERLVRDTQNLARRTGVGMENMMQLMAGAGQRADAMGLDRSFSVEAVQGGTAFGAAFGNRVGGVPAWGRSGKDAMIMMDTQLTLNAAKSQAANQMAVTLRLADDLVAQGRGNDPRTAEFRAMAEAIRSGQTTFGANGQSVYLAGAQYRRMLSDAGIDPAMAGLYQGQTGENQRVISENNLQTTARLLQGQLDARPRLEQAFGSAFRTALPPNLRGRARELAGQASRAFLEMDPSQIADMDAVVEAMGLGNDPQRETIKQALIAGRGQMQSYIERSPRLRGFKSFDNFVQLNNTRTLRDARVQVDEAQVESRLQSALAGIGRAGPLERLVDAFTDARPGTDFKDILAKTIGFVPAGDVASGLEETIFRLREEKERYQGVGGGEIQKRAADIRDKMEAAQGGDKEKYRRQLQLLADVYTGGNADALANFAGTINIPDAKRAEIRASALQRIGRLTTQARELADQAGLEIGGRVGINQVEGVIDALDRRRGDFVGGLDTLAEGLLTDDASMRVLNGMGAGGTDRVLGIQSRNRELRSLAAKHASGDVAALVATNDDRKEAVSALNEQVHLGEQIKAAEAEAEKVRLDPAATQEQRDQAIARVNQLKQAYGVSVDRVNALQKRTGASASVLAKMGDIGLDVRDKARGLMAAQGTDVAFIRDRLRGGVDESRKAERALEEQMKGVRLMGLSPLEYGLYQQAEDMLKNGDLSPADRKMWTNELEALTDRARTGFEENPALRAQYGELRGQRDAIVSSRTADEARRKDILASRYIKDDEAIRRLASVTGVKEGDLSKALGEGGIAGERGRRLRDLLPDLQRLQTAAKEKGLSLGAFLQGGGPDYDPAKADAEAKRLGATHGSKMADLNKDLQETTTALASEQDPAKREALIRKQSALRKQMGDADNDYKAGLKKLDSSRLDRLARDRTAGFLEGRDLSSLDAISIGKAVEGLAPFDKQAAAAAERGRTQGGPTRVVADQPLPVVIVNDGAQPAAGGRNP